jgi:hypothetical protein
VRNNDVKLLGHRDMLLLRYVIIDTQCIINRSDELNPRTHSSGGISSKFISAAPNVS